MSTLRFRYSVMVKDLLSGASSCPPDTASPARPRSPPGIAPLWTHIHRSGWEIRDKRHRSRRLVRWALSGSSKRSFLPGKGAETALSSREAAEDSGAPGPQPHNPVRRHRSPINTASKRFTPIPPLYRFILILFLSATIYEGVKVILKEPEVLA